MSNIQGFMCFILLHLSYAKHRIYISPKDSVLQGERVNISCSFDVEPNTLQWNHNNAAVGEDGTSYSVDFFEIQKIGFRYDLIIKNVTLKHRGKWSCDSAHEKHEPINLDVSVPWTLKAISVKKVVNKVQNVANHNKSRESIETGHKRYPFDISMNETLEISCESECGLPAPKSISIQFTNKTTTGELVGGRQKNVACVDDAQLSSLVHTININCLTSRLVGRNEIRCQSQGAGGNTLSNTPIFILCPTYMNPSALTRGEMIAIAVAIFLAAFDVVIIVMLLRQNLRRVASSSQSKSDIIRCPEIML